MTKDLTFYGLRGVPARAVQSRCAIHLAARAARRAHAMPRGDTVTDAPRGRRFDLDAALLALIFGGQLAVSAHGVAQALGGHTEPHVDRASIVASAPLPRAP